MALSGAQKPPVANYLYRHVIMNNDQTDMRSNCGDIFDAHSADSYYGKKIVLMIREPINRIESEFGFLGNRTEFRSLWEHGTGLSFPTSLIEFVNHPATHNSICKFLLGKSMYGNDTITQNDFRQVMNTLDTLDFVYGNTNDMGLTVQNVEYHCSLSIQHKHNLPRYRTSLHKPERGIDWREIEESFNASNKFDLELFNELTIRFSKQIEALPTVRDVSFKGDNYDSVYLFLNGNSLRSPFEIFANESGNSERVQEWVDSKRGSLNPVVERLLPQFEGDGKRFLVAWLEETIPELLKEDTRITINKEDPLQTLKALTLKLFSPSP